MTPSHIALAMLLSILVVIFIQRMTSSSNVRLMSIRNLLYFLISSSLILIIINRSNAVNSSKGTIFSNKDRSFHSSIAPNVFSQMVKFDVNYISGVFFERGFKRLELNDPNDAQNIEYLYTLLFDPSNNNRYLSTLSDWEKLDWENEIREYAYTQTKIPNAVFYVLKKEQDYNDFYKYIVEFHNDKIPDEVWKHLSASDRTSSYIFDGCVFKFMGFQIHENGFCIEVYDLHSLLRNNNIHQAIFGAHPSFLKGLPES